MQSEFMHQFTGRFPARPVLLAVALAVLAIPVMAWYRTTGSTGTTIPSAVPVMKPQLTAEIQPTSNIPGPEARLPVSHTDIDSSDSPAAPGLPHNQDKLADQAITVADELTGDGGTESMYDAPAPSPETNPDHLYISNIGNEIIISRNKSGTRDVTAAEMSGQPAGRTDTQDITAAEMTQQGQQADEPVWATPSCPNELPPGSTRDDADYMEQLYGCWYMSACFETPDAGDNPCTFYFRGQGRS